MQGLVGLRVIPFWGKPEPEVPANDSNDAVDPRTTAEVQLDYSKMAYRDHCDVALVCGAARPSARHLPVAARATITKASARWTSANDRATETDECKKRARFQGNITDGQALVHADRPSLSDDIEPDTRPRLSLSYDHHRGAKRSRRPIGSLRALDRRLDEQGAGTADRYRKCGRSQRYNWCEPGRPGCSRRLHTSTA